MSHINSFYRLNFRYNAYKMCLRLWTLVSAAWNEIQNYGQLHNGIICYLQIDITKNNTMKRNVRNNKPKAVSWFIARNKTHHEINTYLSLMNRHILPLYILAVFFSAPQIYICTWKLEKMMKHKRYNYTCGTLRWYFKVEQTHKSKFKKGEFR